MTVQLSLLMFCLFFFLVDNEIINQNHQSAWKNAAHLDKETFVAFENVKLPNITPVPPVTSVLCNMSHHN